METQEQMSETIIGTEAETQSPEQEKTVRDDIVSAIMAEIGDRELQLKLIATTESFLGGKENYSIPDFTQLLWNNLNEYKQYLSASDRLQTVNNNEDIDNLDQAFRTRLMPKVVDIITEDRLKHQIEQIRANAQPNQ